MPRGRYNQRVNRLTQQEFFMAQYRTAIIA